MTERKRKPELVDVKELLERDDDFLRTALQALVEAALKAEMIETIGAAKGERSATRLAYRSGYYGRSLITRVGILPVRRVAVGRSYPVPDYRGEPDELARFSVGAEGAGLVRRRVRRLGRSRRPQAGDP